MRNKSWYESWLMKDDDDTSLKVLVTSFLGFQGPKDED